MGWLFRFLTCVTILIQSSSASPTPEDRPRVEAANSDNHATSTRATFHSLRALEARSSLPSTTVSVASAGAPGLATVNANAIKSGLTSFGESYAAGFGTGVTSSDSCAQGEFSYGKILFQGSPEGAIFERRECSGSPVIDILYVPEVGGQIDDWQHYATADVVTLSVGGIDIGFGGLITSCFLRILGPPNCTDAITDARETLKNGTLQSYIEIAMLQIITKSTRDDLKVFLTGYPAFFNVDTKFCDRVTFVWRNPRPLGPDEKCDLKEAPCLTQKLRLEINDLAADINRMLSAAVDRVNAREKGQKVHFIDPNPVFNGHRFCEVDNGKEVEEPQPGRADTWFFLSAWPDNKLDGSGMAAQVNDIDPAFGDENRNFTAIPPSATVCENTKSPKNWFLCQIARVNEDPTLPLYKQLVQQQREIAAGNFSASHLKWWQFTRQYKTFHPRTLGHKGYAELIQEVALRESGGEGGVGNSSSVT